MFAACHRCLSESATRSSDNTNAQPSYFARSAFLWASDLSARRFFQKALAAPGHPRPRVINVDGNPSYPNVIQDLKRDHVLGRRCRCRVVPYLNNIVEQDHRSIKRRVNTSLGFRSLMAHNARFRATKQCT
ncbi:MAG: DDE-type integrase/transposase/recombinase [Bryobacteraceae bacterium]